MIAHTIEPPYLELAYYMGRHRVGPALRALEVDFQSAVGAPKALVHGVVGLVKEAAEEIEVIGEIVVLRSEGATLGGSVPLNRTHLKRLGGRVYRRFVDVADMVEPIYAAILIEYSLETPDELRSDPRNLAFRDFFLDRAHIDEHTINEILRLAREEAYVEKRRAGVYVSLSELLNPKGRGVAAIDALERSARIGALLGKSLVLES